MNQKELIDALYSKDFSINTDENVKLLMNNQSCILYILQGIVEDMPKKYAIHIPVESTSGVEL